MKYLIILLAIILTGCGGGSGGRGGSSSSSGDLASFNNDQAELLSYMQYLSQKYYNVEWLYDFEYKLWSTFIGDSKYDRVLISFDENNTLNSLQNLADGWIYMDEYYRWHFISASEWTTLYSYK